MIKTTFPEWRPLHYWFRFSDHREAILPLLARSTRWGVFKLESLPWGAYGDLVGETPFSLEHRIAAISTILTLFKPICELTIPPSLHTDWIQGDSNPVGLEIQEKSTHILDLRGSFDELWSTKFQARNRTAIRRAQERGVQIGWSNQSDAVAAMKSLYENAVQRWEGVETIPPAFFDALTDFSENHIRIWQAHYQGHVIASDVMLYGCGEVQYFTGASDPDRSDLNGSKYLMSEIIRDACERGYSEFNFGASGGLQGVEQFKKLFGGESVPYTRMRFVHPCFRRLKGFKRWIRIRG